MLNAVKVVTLGGCTTNEVAKILNCPEISYVRHFWKRPTIAMMSAQICNHNDITNQLPDAVKNYVNKDLSKQHREELSRVDADTVIFDITRDLFTSVIEIEDGAFIANPMDLRAAVSGFAPEDYEEDHHEKIFSKYRHFHHAGWDDFFPIWKKMSMT